MPGAVSARPNVLFVTVDQWPGNLLGSAGHPVIETPTLDHLASVGTRFSRTYSECPICIPARRTIMTGTSPRRHGDRVFQPSLRMPEDLPTLAETFGRHGYQTQAIGKLHVYPQRDRIGFDDALLAEEGRGALGGTDDYEMFLADKGYAGQQFMHGMSNNEYSWRTWHLPEETHVTNWTTWAAARTIRRRDPTRPGFWHVSYTPPHPPLIPLASYLERYRARQMDEPYIGDWAKDDEGLPLPLELTRDYWARLPSEQLADMRRAFYALCTHIDHQIRILVGTLREEHILDNTVIMITSDHGDMLGNHGFYAKRLMYEGSANVPMIVVGTESDRRVQTGSVDDRLVGLQDVMPTLLDLCGLPVPKTCEGRSMVSEDRRDFLYGEALSGPKAMRMLHDGRHKLIWYPAGSRFQLFDLELDPNEMVDRIDDEAYAGVTMALKRRLRQELYGEDLEALSGDHFVGVSVPAKAASSNRGLSGQRGLHFPAPPLQDPSAVVGGV
ncbi:sulfatase-like hydrolase/transferase [Rhizobium wenxiniae]|uniref:sulfatase-like hydrolase/transferase n=1 Tax=Rhizobium wenxiniae TaxID=1737357 RepID=UPI001C6E8493|nr:sulfatase-like hydrolase/transferase [Rhizobium wenxiniae]MBW9089799.1 sulfatase-like hydrolase/transferase [Rhizobium wenxiniae]